MELLTGLAVVLTNNLTVHSVLVCFICHTTGLKYLHERIRPKAWQWFNSLEMELQSEIVRAFGHMPELEEDWPSLADGPAWTWWLLAFLPLSQELKVGNIFL